MRRAVVKSLKLQLGAYRLAGAHHHVLIGERPGDMLRAEEIGVRLAEHVLDRPVTPIGLEPTGADTQEPAFAVLEEDPHIGARELVTQAEPIDLLLREVTHGRI